MSLWDEAKAFYSELTGEAEEANQQRIRETGGTNVTSRERAAEIGGFRGGTEQEQEERLESSAERLRKQVFAEQLYLIAFKVCAHVGRR